MWGAGRGPWKEGKSENSVKEGREALNSFQLVRSTLHTLLMTLPRHKEHAHIIRNRKKSVRTLKEHIVPTLVKNLDSQARI